MFSDTLLAYSVNIQICPCRDRQVIDHANAAALATAGNAPSQLPDASRTGNDGACFRIREERLLQSRVLVVRKVLLNQHGKKLRLYECYHL